MKDDVNKHESEYLRVQSNLDYLINEVIPFMEARPDLVEFDAYECTDSNCKTYRCLLGWYTFFRYGMNVEGAGYEYARSKQLPEESIFNEDESSTFIRTWTQHEFGKYVPLPVFGAREEGSLQYRKNELNEYVDYLQEKHCVL